MNKILLNYDVHDNHDEIRKILVETHKWSDKLDGVYVGTNNPGTCFLPDTTFWKAGLTVPQAMAEFKAITTEPNIKRLLCVEFNEWQGEPGKPHADDSTTEVSLKPRTLKKLSEYLNEI